MISLYLGWSGFQGVRFLLPVIVCQTLTFSGLNTFSTPGKLTDLVQTNPANFKKKGCEKPSFLLTSGITKQPKTLLVSMAGKEVIKGPRDNPKQIH